LFHKRPSGLPIKIQKGSGDKYDAIERFWLWEYKNREMPEANIAGWRIALLINVVYDNVEIKLFYVRTPYDHYLNIMIMKLQSFIAILLLIGLASSQWIS
jgi:hypothetical protein